MLEHLLDEVAATGLLDHVCPEFEDGGEMAMHLIGLLYLAELNSRGDFYRKVMQI